MPSQLSYPGIYIEEVPSPVRTVVGVPTAVAAFVGRTRMGPVDTPVRIKSFADLERTFGTFWEYSELPQAVQQYFLNGGADAYVVRVHNGATAAQLTLPCQNGTLNLVARHPGSWSRNLSAKVDYATRQVVVSGTLQTLGSEFNLVIECALINPVTGTVDTVREEFRNVSIDANAPNFVSTVLRDASRLVVVDATATLPPNRPNVTTAAINAGNAADGSAAGDGNALTANQLTPAGGAKSKSGIFALEDAEIFTMLVLPGYAAAESTTSADLPAGVWTSALQYCQRRRAILLVNAPASWKSKSNVVPTQIDVHRDKNSVSYFPRVLFPDPLQQGRARPFSPSAALAGIMARTDQNRGVWKAPAGEEARVVGALGLEYTLSDEENGDLNPLAINCLRTFPLVGTVCWGARTLAGADAQASEWKYLSVRRTALFIEETLYRATRWILFEPNDEPLWAQIRLNIGAFMQSLFRQGAFQGGTPKEAYFVKCDAQTTTQDDINKGIVNILVGFAPLKPVEFVVLKISQLAGRSVE